MVESTEQDPYLRKLEDVEDEMLKQKLKSLFEAGQSDFDNNKYILEVNPDLGLEDIVAILESGKKEHKCDGRSPEGWSDEDSSDAYAGDLDEQDLDDMSELLLEINGAAEVE